MGKYNVIRDVTLVKFEKGVQTYTWDHDECPEHQRRWKEMQLSGLDRASNVKVGDRGRLVYKTGPTYGMYFFEKQPPPGQVPEGKGESEE